MPETPGPKLVRWALDNAPSGDASSPTPSSPERNSTSTLAFVSSQLVAHGFTRPPGLVGPLGQLGPRDQEVVVKCLMNLLEQRVTDMERTEELTTRFNTLSYDHERLLEIHKTAKEQAARARRETELTKSKHATTITTLTDLQATHKQTVANLQKAQSALQFARQTAQNEIKRKEKEVERVMERWLKVSNEQPKIGGVTSGLRCSNLAAGSGTVIPRANSALETSLAQLKTDRDKLTEQNEAFRNVLISLAIGLDKLTVRNDEALRRPARAVTDLTVFPPSDEPWREDAGNARRTLHELLTAVRARLESQARSRDQQHGNDDFPPNDNEKQQLINQVNALTTELEESRKALAEQMSGALDAFARDQRLIRGNSRPSSASDASFDGMTAIEREEWEKRLAEREDAFDAEKNKLTIAAIELGKERAAIAAAKLELQEERRAWRLQQMLDEMPETPVASTSAPAPTKMAPIPPPRFSGATVTRDDVPKFSAARVAVASHNHPKRHRMRSPKKAGGVRLSPTKSPRRRMHILENEMVIEEDIAEAAEESAEEELGVDPNPMRPVEMPPPSPQTNPFDQILAQSAQAAQSLNRLNISPERPKASAGGRWDDDDDTNGSGRSTSPLDSVTGTPRQVSLNAAQERLKRNPYAPSVPSPLSRILRMADSPPLGRSIFPEFDNAKKWDLDNVIEEEDEGAVASTRPTNKSLAAELGIGSSSDDSSSDGAGPSGPRKSVRRSPSPVRRPTAREKGKWKAVPGPPPRVGTGAFKAREKENAFPTSKKISIGHRVVGGRPAPIVPNLARRAVQARQSGAVKSLRDEVKARNLLAQGISRQLDG